MLRIARQRADEICKQVAAPPTPPAEKAEGGEGRRLDDIEAELAQDIRAIDGNHDKGAGELAEQLVARGWRKADAALLAECNRLRDLCEQCVTDEAVANETVTRLEGELANLKATLAERDAFKLKTHSTLDSMKVPTCEGVPCRIAARLAWVDRAFVTATSEIERLRAEVERRNDLIGHCWVHSGYRDCGSEQMDSGMRELYRSIVDKDLSAGDTQPESHHGR